MPLQQRMSQFFKNFGFQDVFALFRCLAKECTKFSVFFEKMLCPHMETLPLPLKKCYKIFQKSQMS